MNIGFFTVLRRDPQHFLHAEGLVDSIRRSCSTAKVVQFTDESTPMVSGVDSVQRLPSGPMLERRLEHYASRHGRWLFVDTDVQILEDVSGVFSSNAHVIVADRNWPGVPQGDEWMHTMPFNTGVVFSQSQGFWKDVLSMWRALPSDQRDWMSEQRCFYQVVRTGRYRVQIVPGQEYNYPPRSADDPCAGVKIAHYKGDRKLWLTERIRASWRNAPVESKELVGVA